MNLLRGHKIFQNHEHSTQNHRKIETPRGAKHSSVRAAAWWVIDDALLRAINRRPRFIRKIVKDQLPGTMQLYPVYFCLFSLTMFCCTVRRREKREGKKKEKRREATLTVEARTKETRRPRTESTPLPEHIPRILCHSLQCGAALYTRDDDRRTRSIVTIDWPGYPQSIVFF